MAARSTDRAARGDVDRRFLGLDDEGALDRTSFVVAPHLVRFDHRLYGGTAIAASLAAIERATGRDAVWATTQFTAIASLGDRIHVDAEVLATGRRASQVRITARVGPRSDTEGDAAGDIVFCALGAAVEPKPDGMAGTPEHMPEVRAPGSGRRGFAPSSEGDVGWHQGVEIRVADIVDHPDSGEGRLCLWVRLLDGDIPTAARLAFVADLIPLSVARGIGRTGAGTSLDNTLRVGEIVDTEWVLVDLRPHRASGGYGQGTAHLWAEDGTLLATASQSASMLELEMDPLDGFPFG